MSVFLFTIVLETRICGISVTFGPPADLGVDYRWGTVQLSVSVDLCGELTSFKF